MFSGGTCPYPFVAKSDYPELGGDTNARFCAPVPTQSGFAECCLPCPKQNYFYPDSFQRIIHGTTYVNLASVVCCCFLLLSFAVLPVEYTHRHYLSVCLTIAILLMQLSFVIPMGNPDTQCYDKITPHDMYSSINCALSGALLLGGGWSTVMWAFLRTLSVHLQICWQVVPGRRFFLTALAAGWSIPIVFLAVALSVTGVSFRFGESCHINSRNGLQTFWGPLLAVAAGSIVTHTITFCYCIPVYLRSLFEDKQGTSNISNGSALPYSNSVRTVTAAQAFRRIRRVIALQWRGIFVVIIIITDVVFFATVFLQFDGTTQKTPENVRHAYEWLLCVVHNDGDKTKCQSEANRLVVSEGIAISVLFLLSMNGIWALLLLGRPSIFQGWYELTKSIFPIKRNPGEFVSYDARRVSDLPESSYEMLESKQRDTMTTDHTSTLKVPEPSLNSAPRGTHSIREYNPSTISAQLRERADATTNIYDPTYTPYQNSYSLRSPPLSSPFSPFRDRPNFSPEESNINMDGRRRATLGKLRSSSNAGSVASPQFSPYADSPCIEDHGSPRSPNIGRLGGIGIAK
ncbi:hypothetical protein EDC01DRAFT_613714 [Geopyxis carbonaria]|nr:hypothetical protein EDC01DRAFT_613714 [Geopyxis carbonaria]